MSDTNTAAEESAAENQTATTSILDQQLEKHGVEGFEVIGHAAVLRHTESGRYITKFSNGGATFETQIPADAATAAGAFFAKVIEGYAPAPDVKAAA